MSKAHIAMLLTNPYRPDPRVLKEANSLASMGYKVTIICWDRQKEYPQKEPPDTGVNIIRVQHIVSTYGIGARQLLKLPRFWQAAYSMLNQLQPDLIHCHDFDTLPAGLLWGGIHHHPVIYDAHEYYADFCKPRLRGLTGKFLYHFIRTAEKTGARLASAIVTVDESLAAIYRKLNKRVLVLGHYPARSLISQPAPIFTRTNLTLLYIGRLSVDRGLLKYADLLRILHNKGIPARLYLAGTFTPTSDEAIFQRYSYGLNDAIDLAGWVHYSKISDILQLADIGLAILQPEPRYIAALPVKLFEYMAAGLPVIASNFPPIATIVNETQCGALVDPLDPQTAANKISEWWAHPDKAQKIGNNGYQAILQKYNWEILIEQLHYLYVSLIQD